MGLDTVEMIMAVEDAFGIAIPDEQAQYIETAGDLYQLVLTLLGHRRNEGVCASAHAFYRIRGALMDCGVAQRRDVHLDFYLADRFEGMPGAWAFFNRALGLKVTRLSLQCDTVRGFINTHGYALGKLADPIVWHRLAEIIAGQVGLETDAVHPGSRFVDDLQMD
jgi:acyl carrier protein